MSDQKLPPPLHGRPNCIVYKYMQNVRKRKISDMQISRFGRFGFLPDEALLQ